MRLSAHPGSPLAARARPIEGDGAGDQSARSHPSPGFLFPSGASSSPRLDWFRPSNENTLRITLWFHMDLVVVVPENGPVSD
ncbi:hypothetical protein VTH06DRAFT_3906 [Thermothelomyces fergusii]